MKPFAAFLIVCLALLLAYLASDHCAKRQCGRPAELAVGIAGVIAVLAAVYWMQSIGWLASPVPIYPGGG